MTSHQGIYPILSYFMFLDFWLGTFASRKNIASPVSTGNTMVTSKIINNLVDINLSESHLHLTNSITRGHPLRLTQLQTNLDCYKHSFLPHAIRIWNSLPIDVVLSATLDAFKENLNTL